MCLIDIFDEKPKPVPAINVNIKGNRNRNPDANQTVGVRQHDDIEVPWCATTTFCQRSNMPKQPTTYSVPPDMEMTSLLHENQISELLDAECQREDGCISGRLEIRVIPKGKH